MPGNDFYRLNTPQAPLTAADIKAITSRNTTYQSLEMARTDRRHAMMTDHWDKDPVAAEHTRGHCRSADWTDAPP